MLACLLAALSLSAASAQVLAPVLTPEAHFGFRMGADRELAPADAIERYFEQVAAASDRVELVDLGKTTDGNRTVAAIISAPENIRNLTRIRAANQRLADPRTLPQDDARTLAATHKVVRRDRRQHSRLGDRRQPRRPTSSSTRWRRPTTPATSTCCRTSSSS